MDDERDLAGVTDVVADAPQTTGAADDTVAVMAMAVADALEAVGETGAMALAVADPAFLAPSDDACGTDVPPELLHAPLPETTPAAVDDTGHDQPAQRVHSPSGGYRVQVPETAITCVWTLAELPSPQHRAGLAGLAFLVEYTHHFPLPPGAVLELIRLDDHGLALRLDRAGLAALFDRVYAANLVDGGGRRRSSGSRGRGRPATSSGNVADMARESAASLRNSGDPGSGTAAATGADPAAASTDPAVATLDDGVVVPDGGPLRDWSPPGDGGSWLRLWQHCLWSVLRAIPQQRWPYQVRARAGVTATAAVGPRDAGRDVAEAWAGLCGDLTSRLASTHFLGAMDANAERIPFLERSRRLFLLHFWPFVAQIFVPYTAGSAPGMWTRSSGTRPAAARPGDGKSGNSTRPTTPDDDAVADGYALCIPNIVRLAAFVRLHPRVMRARPAERLNWRPRAAHIAIGAAGAAQVERWMRAQNVPVWDGGGERIVAGFQVIEAARDGHVVRILANRMVDPTPALIGALGVADRLRCPHLRRLVLGNALGDRPWWLGGDRLCTTLPTARTVGDAKFRADLQALFGSDQAGNDPFSNPTGEAQAPETSRALDGVIHDAVQQWLDARLAGRPTSAHTRYAELNGLNPSAGGEVDVPRSPLPRAAARRKLAGTAFHAARRRSTARDFTAWFVATFGAMLSANGTAPKALIVALAREPDQVRTLTLLALAADKAADHACENSADQAPGPGQT